MCCTDRACFLLGCSKSAGISTHCACSSNFCRLGGRAGEQDLDTCIVTKPKSWCMLIGNTLHTAGRNYKALSISQQRNVCTYVLNIVFQTAAFFWLGKIGQVHFLFVHTAVDANITCHSKCRLGTCNGMV